MTIEVAGASKAAIAAVEKAGGKVDAARSARSGAERHAGGEREAAGPAAVRRRRGEVRHRAAGMPARIVSGMATWRQPPNSSLPASISAPSQGNRAQEAGSGSRWRAGDLPAGHVHPDPRHRPRDPAGHLLAQCRRHPRHVRHVLGRRARAHDDLRPEHHAVHLGLDHHPAADGGVAAAGGAEEGGRERPQEAQPVHPLRHRRAGRGAVLRHRRRARRDALRRAVGGHRPRAVLPARHGDHA